MELTVAVAVAVAVGSFSEKREKTKLVPMAAKAVGISFDELINRIIERNWN
ncbi:MAG: hypothetical protein U9R23_06900 [Candidatus Cloacimonadota bacterium]|nr:hypothetical protein [Candidatus Cloacimonadota bacterium]